MALKTNTTDEENSNLCGLFSWRPVWLQKFLSFKLFVLLFMIISSTQTIILSYLTVVLSTIEKEFGLQSKEAAWVYSGNEIAQVLFIVFLPFVGKTKRRPLYIGIGACISAIGMLLIALPHFVGRGKEFQKDYLNAQLQSVNVSCQISDQLRESCDKESAKDWLGISIVFIGILLIGIGNAAIISLGTPYLDDNTGKKSSPMALSLGFAARVAGPAIGYMIGYICLKEFVNPGEEPEGFDEDNPLWIGAWWKGCVIIGVFVLVISPIMTLFPGDMPIPGKIKSPLPDQQEIQAESLNFKDFFIETWDMGKRLIRNKIYVLHVLATTFIIMAIIGFATFLPKYFEYMFRQRASSSIAGPAMKSIFAVCGLLLAGAVVTKWQPRARILIGSSVFGTALGVIAFVVFTQIGCPPLKFYGTQSGESEAIIFSNLNCNTNHGCSSDKYQPICSVDGETHFFSPCQAGCRMCEKQSHGNSNITLYKECTCVSANAVENGKSFAPNWPLSWPSRDELPPATLSKGDTINHAYAGYCPSDCQNQYYLILGLFGMIGFVFSANRLPALLVFMRAVEPRDKTTAFTLTVSILSLLALIPGPLIFGAIFDGSCTVWGTRCGEKLNCFAYDTDALRVRVGAFSAILIFCSMCCEIGIFYLAKDLRIYDDTDDSGTKDVEENPTIITNESSGIELDEN